MNSRFLTGEYFTKSVNYIFRIFHIIFDTIRIFVSVLNTVLVKLFASKIDAFLSNIAKRSVVKKTKTETNTLMFIAMQAEYTCNSKYITEEILRRNLPYDITWVLRSNSLGPFPEGVSLVKEGSADYYKAAARSKVIVQNGHTLQRTGVQKNKNQYWIQTWHGSLGLKRLEGAGGDDKFYNEMKRLQSNQTDFLLSNSAFEDDVFSSTYWPNVPSLKLGHARNDILFDNSKATKQHVRNKVLRRLGIKDVDQKFLLFAPTHDDKNLDQAFGNIDLESLRSTLSEKFGGTWEILIRTHNSNKKQSSRWFAGLPFYCHNASFYPDMQELMVVADIGLTDYSSWICDYIMTGKPSFLFGVNIKKYDANRGFYHEISETPFSMATNNRELIDNISSFVQNDYEFKIKKFLDKCGSMDDGKASKRIVDKIEDMMSD